MSNTNCVNNFLFLKKKIFFSNNSHKHKIKILILNKERFSYDVEVLKKNKRFEIIILDSKLQLFINNLWMHNTRVIFKNWRLSNQLSPFNSLYFSKDNKKIINSRNNLMYYLCKLIKKLKKEIKFDYIMTCAVWYIQDKEWERACAHLNIPFISIHKECMFDKDVIDKEIRSKRNMQCETYNSKVILYNDKARDVLVESGIVKLKNSYVLGSMRMDYLFSLTQKENIKKNNVITIFSFTHRTGLVEFSKQNTNASFSTYPKEGFFDLFDNFHGQIAILAIRYPNIKFNIKVKW